MGSCVGILVARVCDSIVADGIEDVAALIGNSVEQNRMVVRAEGEYVGECAYDKSVHADANDESASATGEMVDAKGV